MIIKMRKVENGKKWRRLHEPLGAWVQGRERSVCSFARDTAITCWKMRGLIEFVGCHIEGSPVWRSTELPLNPYPKVKPPLSHPQSTGSWETPSPSPPLPSIPLNITVLKLLDVPFMTEITCLGTDTWISLKVHRIINDKINITEASIRALTIHPPPTPPFPRHHAF